MTAKLLQVNKDAWSQGQIKSKLWLIEELEKITSNEKQKTIWVLGGWYGLLSFLILTRNKIQPVKICSFDVDAESTELAKDINNNWLLDPQIFYSFTADCTQLNYNSTEFHGPADIIINTSCEHFADSWMDSIPPQTLIAAQSTNMEHVEHINKVNSLADFQNKFQNKFDVLYKGELMFNYPNLKFNRFMIIARKK